MGFMERALGAIGIAPAATEQRSLENPSVSLSSGYEELLQVFGVLDRNNALPLVSIEAALQVPAVLCAVAFLSRTLSALPLHTFAAGDNGERINDGPSRLLSFAPNEVSTSFDWRRHHWQQVFTGGRGMSWIERAAGRPIAIWPMDPSQTVILRRAGKRVYRFCGQDYDAVDVIDTPFMLKADGLGSYSPLAKCNKAISLAIAMSDFAGGFFAGGGVPPLALTGPLPSGADAYRRAQNDIQRAINLAKQENSSIVGMPPGHELKPIGVEPDKGQMTEARLFQIQEIARILQLPPVFLQDLSKGTFSNTEQQDLQLVKHLIAQWAKAFEDELTLKLHGWNDPKFRGKHNLDGLQRGAFKDRTEALARSVNSMLLMPDEARALEGRPPLPDGLGARPYVQGATVPAAMSGQTKPGKTTSDNLTQEDANNGDAQTEN
jgi:HK97 family phage portal protein